MEIIKVCEARILAGVPWLEQSSGKGIGPGHLAMRRGCHEKTLYLSTVIKVKKKMR